MARRESCTQTELQEEKHAACSRVPKVVESREQAVACRSSILFLPEHRQVEAAFAGGFDGFFVARIRVAHDAGTGVVD